MRNTTPKNQTLLQFMLRAQHIAQQDARSDKGYAMMLASIVSILMFSMLGAYLTMTNLSKSSTNAYIDNSNTFYAAESGLNRRASQIRDKFRNYTIPAGTSPGSTTSITSANMSSCYSVSTTASVTTNDFECRNYNFKYNNNTATAKDRDGNIVLSDTDNNSNTVNYTAYTFVTDKTICASTTATPPCTPASKVVPAGENYAGLNVIENRYVVYATAAKPDSTNSTQPLASTNAKTVLQMEFKNRAIPLFQFAVFYDGDLEMTSTSNMDISGRVHTNSNLYLQPNTDTNATTFMNSITAAGGIYRRADAMITGSTAGAVRLQLTSSSGTITYLNFPAYNSSLRTPIDLTASTIGSLNAANTAIFKSLVKDGVAGITTLNVPSAGFLRKRNYFKSSIATTTAEQAAAVGNYWAKADMRLEMVPDRDAVRSDGVTSLTTTEGANAIANGTAWNRNEAIIPFNFTSIQTGGSGACSTTPPAANADPANNYINPQRNNATNLSCNIFTKGQLQSLRQPVLVLTKINQPGDATLKALENTVLEQPTLPTTPTLSVTANIDATKNKILRALQVAIVSTPTPIAIDRLDTKFNNSAYNSGNLNVFKTEFNRLLSTIPVTELPAADLALLLTSSPKEIAALQGAWFLPAPIQRLASDVDTTTGRDNSNIRSSGFYDGREQRWITMLQTNIKSLTVWNRDGLYVEATTAANTAALSASNADTNLRTPYQTNLARKNEAFNAGSGANSTEGMAFVRAAADSTKTGFKKLGLGSTNATEGGLVFHATVSDDLNGDGTTTDVATEVQKNADGTDKYLKNADGTDMYEKNADGSYKLNGTNRIRSRPDYIRKYWNQPGYNSPFGFAFNGGNFLPAAMNITTDQAIYIQGDFNNNGAAQRNSATNVDPSSDRLPAAIMGDTITNLSNQCIADSSTKSATNHLGVLAGQIDCGLPRSTTGAINLTQSGNTATYYAVTGPTAVNAAYLSNTDQSIGNCRTVGGTASCGGTTKSSGGLNNYMRMLEDWQQTQYFNYSGSFVSLGTPLEYSGQYLPGGTYYMIPVRNFNFDNNFTSFDKLPPMTPTVVYLQQEVFKRNF